MKRRGAEVRVIGDSMVPVIVVLPEVDFTAKAWIPPIALFVALKCSTDSTGTWFCFDVHVITFSFVMKFEFWLVCLA